MDIDSFAKISAMIGRFVSSNGGSWPKMPDKVCDFSFPYGTDHIKVWHHFVESEESELNSMLLYHCESWSKGHYLCFAILEDEKVGYTVSLSGDNSSIKFNHHLGGSGGISEFKRAFETWNIEKVLLK